MLEVRTTANLTSTVHTINYVTGLLDPLHFEFEMRAYVARALSEDITNLAFLSL